MTHERVRGDRRPPGRRRWPSSRVSAARDVQRAITDGRVLVDGEPRAKSFRLMGGEASRSTSREVVPLAAEGPPVPVRFRDEHLLIVAKPAGLVTHPTQTRRDPARSSTVSWGWGCRSRPWAGRCGPGSCTGWMPARAAS